MKIEFTVPALKDLEDIKNYIKRDSPYYADVYIEKIFNSVSKLGDFPNMGRKVPEYNKENIREIIFGNYRIIYEIAKSKINILAVVHGARILKKAMKKRKKNL